MNERVSRPEQETAQPQTNFDTDDVTRHRPEDVDPTPEVALSSNPGYVTRRRTQNANDRRRASRELDSLCAVDQAPTHVNLSDPLEHVNNLEPYEPPYADYWADSGMALDARERATAGRKLIPTQRHPHDARDAAA